MLDVAAIVDDVFIQLISFCKFACSFEARFCGTMSLECAFNRTVRETVWTLESIIMVLMISVRGPNKPHKLSNGDF
jgi:hypothetical protein